jgi:hypothetical protein
MSAARCLTGWVVFSAGLLARRSVLLRSVGRAGRAGRSPKLRFAPAPAALSR